MSKALMMLRLIASVSPKHSVGQCANRATMLTALPAERLKGMIRLCLSRNRLSFGRLSPASNPENHDQKNA